MMFNTQTNIRRANVYDAIAAAGAAGITTDALAERFGVEMKVMHNHVYRMMKEQPPRMRLGRPSPLAHPSWKCWSSG
jgi:transposase